MIMAVQKKIKSRPDVINYFKELLFCNTYIEKPDITKVRNIDLLSEFYFYKKLSVIKTDHAFKGYAVSYSWIIWEKRSINSVTSK